MWPTKRPLPFFGRERVIFIAYFKSELNWSWIGQWIDPLQFSKVNQEWG